jgi:hypothetical protein
MPGLSLLEAGSNSTCRNAPLREAVGNYSWRSASLLEAAT